MARRLSCHIIQSLAMRISNDIFFAEVEALLLASEEVTIPIRGNSMLPMLRDGCDAVVLRRYDGGEVVVGDVMLFRYRAGHVLHRVVRVDREKITFAGDGNYQLYEQASREEIVARMVAYVRDGHRRGCDERTWRCFTRLWTMLPMLLRRVILGIMRRI